MEVCVREKPKYVHCCLALLVELTVEKEITAPKLQRVLMVRAGEFQPREPPEIFK